MSTGLWARDGSGVNRKLSKIYMANGGTNCKLKSLWARDNSGVNRKIFSGAIAWTYEITGDSDSNAGYVVNENNSAFLWWSGSQSDSSTWCDATYTFPEPFTIKAGETITAEASNPAGYRAIYVYVNSRSRCIIASGGSAQSYIGGSYTFTENTVINSVLVSLSLGKDGKANYVGAHVHVNLSSGSFILNNSGSSDQ